ncbi:hypothetical protein [Haloarcula sediminis]|uniref:hypothetical protein n=1 Tax=Haloarcula sediminis TaxID=3111777 RepID=UPI002D799083|nr:hypothetical protein [Haloarcula sp. CK38]
MTRIFSLAIGVALALALVVGFGPGVASGAPADCDDLSEYENQSDYRGCLVENTTPEQLTSYVHTDPSNLTQKQIDAVYAVSPSHDDEFGLNETQQSHITDWMMWEQVGLEPGWYGETATPTRADLDEQTETATPTDRADRLETEIRERVEGTETANDTGNVTGQRIDPNVVLTDWSHSAGTFTLELYNDRARPVKLTITESTQGEEGSYQFAIREERLLQGHTTIRFGTMVQSGESSVSLTTAQSRDMGQGVGVSTGKPSNNPFESFGGTSGVLSGVALAMLMSAAAAGWVVWQEESGVIRA